MAADGPSRGDGRVELARFLRQRVELGSAELFLDGHTRKELLVALAPRPTSAASASMPPAGGASSPRRLLEQAPSTMAARASDHERAKPESVSDLVLPDRHDALRDLAAVCERCALAEGRTNVVFGDGNPEARVMVVGEAPGANEDRTGVPFVGQAGKLLDLLLASVDLSRKDSVYICNVIKCRPPGNRNPRPEEIEACAPYLRRQIEIVQPEVILAVGTFAGQLLTGEKTALGRLRGKVYRYGELPLIVTYHPAALLRNSGWTRATWDDLQLLRSILDAG
ncbi:MAG: uracil-DNA glycosylase [Gemmatimonadota bacterium]